MIYLNDTVHNMLVGCHCRLLRFDVPFQLELEDLESFLTAEKISTDWTELGDVGGLAGAEDVAHGAPAVTRTRWGFASGNSHRFQKCYEIHEQFHGQNKNFLLSLYLMF